MYTKEFEIRWSDIDANRHVANSAYQNFMSHTRMGFFLERGLTLEELARHNLGPVVFYEHIYYFREILLGTNVTVGLQLKGLSEDGMFFEFVHNLYDTHGKNCARCEMLGGWIDLKTRTLTTLPDVLLQRLSELDRTPDFRVLTKQDTRKEGMTPTHLKS